MSEHQHRFRVYGDHGPLDYGDPLAEWCPGCGRLQADIGQADDVIRWPYLDIQVVEEIRPQPQTTRPDA